MHKLEGRSDNLTVEQRKHTMRQVKSENTTPEMRVRRLIHGLGFRYRLHRKDLPGKPDLVFSGRRKVIFVHGCFWHRHDCPAGRKTPKTNSAYWTKKLARNEQRDARNQNQLRSDGWDVLIIWECQLKDMELLTQQVLNFLTSKQ